MQSIRTCLQPERVIPFIMAIMPVACLAAPRGASAFAAVAALLIWLCTFKTMRAWRLPFAATLLFACFDYFLVSAGWSDSPRAIEMARDTAIVMLAGALLLAALPAFSQATIACALRWFAIGFGVAFVYLAIQAAFGFPLEGWLHNRAPNEQIGLTNVPKRAAAILLLFTWPVAGWIATRSGGRHRRSSAILLLLLTALLLPCLFSRTAALGLMLGLAMLLLAHMRPRLARGLALLLLPLAVVTSIAAAFVLLLVLPELAAWLPASGERRIAIWAATVLEAFRHWPLGAGLDGSRVYAPLIPTHPHNIYLQAFMEGGLLGVGLFSLALGALWARLCSVPAQLQPYLWGFVASQAVLLGAAYGLWQGWWLGANLLAGFVWVLVVRQVTAADSAQIARKQQTGSKQISH